MILDGLAFALLGLFALDRLLKTIAVKFFFSRLPPAPLSDWPSVALIQPITASSNDLQAVLRRRAELAYPGPMQQILICDEPDHASQAVIEQVRQEFPAWQPQVLRVKPPDNGLVASKLIKLGAALPQASAEVLCFVDDDVLLPADALQTLTVYLAQSGVGAVFGLACYTQWRNLWSGLMSAFVNSNVLLTYIPFTFFIDPFTITGHCYAMRRPVFEAAGGISDMLERLDDDHEVARRIRKLGLRLCQTPVIYGVDNTFPTWQSYQAQMKRWFVFPRQMMLPYLSPTEQIVSLLGSLGNLIPGLLALLALLTFRAATWQSLAAVLGVISLVYILTDFQFLRHELHPFNLQTWLLVLASALLSPFQIVWALLSNDEVEWRGQRLQILRGGKYKRL